MSRIIVELAAPVVGKLARRPVQPGAAPDSLAQIARDLNLPKLAKVLQAHGNPYSETLIGSWSCASRVDANGGGGASSTAALVPFYAITIDESARETAGQLAKALRSLKGVVASASFEPRYEGAFGAADSHVDEQDYLLAAPHGLGVVSLGTIDGHAIDGRGCGFADLDMGWDLGHKALSNVKDEVLYPPNVATPLDTHGSSVLGIIIGREKIRGIAQGASVKALLWSSMSPGDVVLKLLQDMESGGNALKFGDVLLIEIEERKPDLPGADDIGGLPVEVQLPVFRIIQQAVSAGLVVIEAAGNGHGPDAGNKADKGWNLDKVAKNKVLAPAWRSKSWWSGFAGWFPWWDHPRSGINDSGAIVVGACQPVVEISGSGSYFQLKDSYNYGSRVDCHAWGAGVMTAGAAPDEYSMFSGTSAAAALIAGVALLVQQMARERLGSPLSPRQLRLLLSDRSLGTAVKEKGKIVGSVPDLAKLEAKLGDLPKLGIRAFADDDGQAGARSAITTATQSPDVLLCTSKVLLPKKRFSGPMPACDAIVRGKSSFIYVRLRNQGAAEASGVRVTAFWAVHEDDSSTAVAWHDLDEVSVAKISATNDFVIAKPIEWKVPASLQTSSGKIDIIVAAGGDLDPRPNLPPVREDGQNGLSRDNLLPFLRANPNVALRTVEVTEST